MIINALSEYLKESEKKLENQCKAYSLYLKQNSPYRTDAEKLIGYVYGEMKQNGMVEKFKDILEKYKISPHFE